MRYYVSAGFKTLSFFLVLPIATNLLPKAEVGRFFFWVAIVQLGAGITTLGFSSTVSRKAYNQRTTDYIAGIGVIVALGTWLLVGLIGLAAGVLTTAVLLAWIARSASMIGEARTIARAEINKLSSVYLAYAATLPIFCILAITNLGPSHAALLVAYAAAEGLIAITGLRTLRIHSRKDFKTARVRFQKAVRQAAGYGMPIMIAGLANLGLNSADRFIIAGLWDFEVVAEFSVMYTIGFASTRFITAPANMKIFPEFVRAHHHAGALSHIRDMSGVAWFASVAYCVVVALLGPLFVRQLLSADYALQGVDFALVGAASSLFLLFTFNSAHLKLKNRTGLMMVLLFVALAINVSLSLILVPGLGYRGAVISTFISYAGLAVWATLRLQPGLIRKRSLVIGGIVLMLIILWTMRE